MVQSVHRAIKLLNTISMEKEIGIRELGRKTGISRSTVQRLISVLEDEGFLFRNSNNKYHLSFKLFQLGSKAILQYDLRNIARPILEEIQSHVQETITLGVMDNGDVIYLDKLTVSSDLQLIAIVGNRGPAHCTGIGKAIMAFLPEAERRRIYREKGLKSYTYFTIVDVDQLERDFEAIRARGFAIEHEERFPGVVSIAAPIRNLLGQVVGAVGIPGFTHRITAERIPLISSYVLKATKEISLLLGYLQKDIPN